MDLLLCVVLTSIALVGSTSLPPVLTGPPSITTVESNGSVTLPCTVSGNGSLSIRWYLGSPFTSLALVPDNDSHYLANNDGSLTVTEFKNLQHGGHYTCKAESNKESSSNVLLTCPGTLTLAEITSGGFIEDPADTTVAPRSMVVLKCSPPPSNPPSAVSWLKNGFSFPTDLSTYIQAESGNLYLLNVTEEDIGDYQCVASNPVTNEMRYSEKAHLDIVDNYSSFNAAHDFLVVPRNTTVRLGESVELECADSVGSEVQWEWLGHASLPLSIIGNNGALLLVEVREEVNGGVFRCSVAGVAEDGGEVVGGYVTADAVLTVVAPPKALLSGDKMSGPPGTSVNLFCILDSSLAGDVQVVWQRGGMIMKTETTSSSSLYTFDLPDTSNSEGSEEIWVQCLMQNEHGCSEEAMTLTIEVPEPPPPTPSEGSEEVLTITSGSGTLELTPGGTDTLSCTADGEMVLGVKWLDDSSLSFTTVPGEASNQAVINISSPGTYTCEAVVSVEPFDLKILTKSVTVSLAESSIGANSTVVTQITATSGDKQDTTVVAVPSPSTASSSTLAAVVSTGTSTSSVSTPIPTPASPPIYISPLSLVESNGSRVTVTCVVRDAITDILWIHSGGNSLLENAELTNTVVGDQTVSTITFDPLVSALEGTLSCSAFDSSFNSLQKDCEICVKMDPVHETTNLIITTNSGTLQLTPGGTTTLLCTANYNQDALTSLIWLKDNIPPTFTTIKTDSYQQAKISITYPGTYICEATLDFGFFITKLTNSVTITLLVSLPVPMVTATSTTANNLITSADSKQPVSSTGQPSLPAVHSTPTVSTAIIATTTTTSSSSSTIRPSTSPAPPVVPPTLVAPVPVSLVWLNGTSLQVTWFPSPLQNGDTTHILGYKMNWGGINDDLPKVALRAFPFKTNQYTIIGLRRWRDYQVKVWLYSLAEDGPAVTLSTLNPPNPTEPPINTSTPDPVITDPPVDTFAIMKIGSCVSLQSNRGLVFLQIQLFQNVDMFLVTYSCPSANVSSSLHAVGMFIPLEDLVPGCQYSVTVAALSSITQQPVAQDSCTFTTTTTEEAAVDFEFVWKEEASDLSITWKLPSLLEELDNVQVEIRVNDTWTVLTDGQQAYEHLNPYKDNSVEIRVTINQMVVYSDTFVVPAAQSPSSVQVSPTLDTSPDTNYSSFIGTPWLTYGIGLVAVILSIILALSLVLTLKHIQAKRRERNKGVVSNRRNRISSLSSQKSLFVREDSMQSIKKPSSHVVQTSVNNIYSYT